MSDRLRAWLRTTIPAAWSALVAWLIAAGVPDWLTGPLGAAGDVLVVLGALYALLRWTEPHMPPWLTRILLGSNTPPTYPPTE
ncbi:hypothetical protein [Saccharopolyspora spinosa]|uniref:Uncharacterized protein n=1 Tax=Saccharopolyspora spinosa TaxID=60894 RepID=A0A2N3YAA3_SACSN|nr:hypothetical protein [Saccharopolyspora spinosa]PKW19854.1 hypothetical protein A8926_8056 [Saccharopolyspora spinosa]